MKQYLDLARQDFPWFQGEPTPEAINDMLEYVCAANHPFIQQASFMQACDQHVDKRAWTQAQLYAELVREEFWELSAEIYEHAAADYIRDPADIDLAQVAKEGIDLIYVVLGLLHSLGIDSVMAFDLVQRSNAAKVDAETGQVRRREDGKILKPDGWQPPDMSAVV